VDELGKKLEDNGMWESSRFMMPEHIGALRMQERGWTKREKPLLDEDQLHTISVAVSQSKSAKQPVTLTLFDTFEDLQVIGIVEDYNSHQRRLKVDGEWFDMNDIISADVPD
jgi:hypothetical protein